MITNSIRWQIQLWHGVLLTIVVVFLLILVSYHEKEMLERVVDQELMGLTPTVLLFHFPHPDQRTGGRHRAPDFSANDLRRNPPEIHLSNRSPSEFYHIVWDDRGEVLAVSPSFPEYITRPGRGTVGWEYHYSDNGNRELIHRHPSGYIGMVGTSASNIRRQWLAFCYWIWGVGLVTLLVAWGVGWMLVNRSLTPLRRISATAKDIAEGDLSKRIETTRAHEELQELAGTLNQTFERLGLALTQQIRFTADASHELRTPLAVVLNECQWALDRERSLTEYREGFETCHSTAMHMSGLVEALMQLARIDAGQEKLKCVTVDLQAVLEECIEMLRAIIRSKHIAIESQLEAIFVKIDISKIQQVVINIVSNAASHSPENSVIKLSSKIDGNWAVIEILDEGSGIPENDLSQIFERFYQSGESRTEAGAGLGLAISKSIIELHGGSINAANEKGKGARFVIRLPL
ncbi:HAMP domain-containing sensor histidine kinase [Rubellicoccus peritrichatus]|uniref:histidine kinase n=1 Tax=Rubellicoccus peritrichatus TaxID=3080537 RepID=A0AAQ3LB59_9BACT|nr:ATP-binding protein [Puniceicoccus sp. CR14]WOO42605.1 ATP-binding protein [Puniceicoccus sp. CR14]